MWKDRVNSTFPNFFHWTLVLYGHSLCHQKRLHWLVIWSVMTKWGKRLDGKDLLHRSKSIIKQQKARRAVMEDYIVWPCVGVIVGVCLVILVSAIIRWRRRFKSVGEETEQPKCKCQLEMVMASGMKNIQVYQVSKDPIIFTPLPDTFYFRTTSPGKNRISKYFTQPECYDPVIHGDVKKQLSGIYVY